MDFASSDRASEGRTDSLCRKESLLSHLWCPNDLRRLWDRLDERQTILRHAPCSYCTGWKKNYLNNQYMLAFTGLVQLTDINFKNASEMTYTTQTCPYKPNTEKKWNHISHYKRADFKRFWAFNFILNGEHFKLKNKFSLYFCVCEKRVFDPTAHICLEFLIHSILILLMVSLPNPYYSRAGINLLSH